MANNLRDAIGEFVDSCHGNYAFPSGDPNCASWTDQELALKTWLLHEEPACEEKLKVFCEFEGSKAGYDIVVFAIRLATKAVETRDPMLFESSLIPLFAAGALIDWRDYLCALAIFEDCSKEIGVDFQGLVGVRMDILHNTRIREVLEGFFSRTDKMRSLETMGIQNLGSPASPIYSSS